MTFGKLIGITTVSLSGLFASVSTLAQTDSIVDVRDGKTYKTSKIGSQWWLAQNLAYAPRILSVSTGEPSVLLTKTDAYFCYRDSARLCERFGVLYRWETAMKACPSGWHLPSEMEYKTLRSSAGPNKHKSYTALIKGGATGFDAVLGGGLFREPVWLYLRYPTEFEQMNRVGFYWTSTNVSKFRKYSRPGVGFVKSLKRVAIYKYSVPSALSVRCIKDQE